MCLRTVRCLSSSISRTVRCSSRTAGAGASQLSQVPDVIGTSELGLEHARSVLSSLSYKGLPICQSYTS